MGHNGWGRDLTNLKQEKDVTKGRMGKQDKRDACDKKSMSRQTSFKKLRMEMKVCTVILKTTHAYVPWREWVDIRTYVQPNSILKSHYFCMETEANVLNIPKPPCVQLVSRSEHSNLAPLEVPHHLDKPLTPAHPEGMT